MSTSSVKTCSERLAKNKVSHIFFTFESGKLKTFGDKSTVEAFENDKEMLSIIKKKLKDSSQLKEAEDEATTIESVSRTELFALPGSEKWKGAAKIREACTQVLNDLGFGRNRSLCYGRGEAPKGRPVLYPWCDPEKGFKGPSHHSVEMCTEIVSSILHHKSQEALVEVEEEEEEEEGEVHAERTHDS